MTTRVEYVRILAENLLFAVPGDIAEGRIHRDDQAFGIRDQNRLAGSIEHPCRQPVLCLSLLAVGQVVEGNHCPLVGLAVAHLHDKRFTVLGDEPVFARNIALGVVEPRFGDLPPPCRKCGFSMVRVGKAQPPQVVRLDQVSGVVTEQLGELAIDQEGFLARCDQGRHRHSLDDLAQLRFSRAERFRNGKVQGDLACYENQDQCHQHQQSGILQEFLAILRFDFVEVDT